MARQDETGQGTGREGDGVAGPDAVAPDPDAGHTPPGAGGSSAAEVPDAQAPDAAEVPDVEGGPAVGEESDAVASGAEEVSDVEGGPGAEAAEGTDRPGAADGRRGWHVRASDLLVLVLCALLGVAAVAQVRHTQEDPLTTLRQDDLVRLLDELDRRNGDLVAEQTRLQDELDGLRSSADSSDAAAEAAAELARTQGVLAGTVPAGGPGVQISITDTDGSLRSQTLVTMIQELRNAGAEAIEINDVRLTATSYVVREPGGMTIDGRAVDSPYLLRAIGDPATMRAALEIPGGALSSARGLGAGVALTEHDRIEIWSVADPRELVHSRVVED